MLNFDAPNAVLKAIKVNKIINKNNFKQISEAQKLRNKQNTAARREKIKLENLAQAELIANKRLEAKKMKELGQPNLDEERLNWRDYYLSTRQSNKPSNRYV